MRVSLQCSLFKIIHVFFSEIGTPKNLRIVLFETEVSLSWDQLTDTGGRTIIYNVTYCNCDCRSLAVNEANITLVGLKHGGRYEMSISACMKGTAEQCGDFLKGEFTTLPKGQSTQWIIFLSVYCIELDTVKAETSYDDFHETN